MKIDKARLRSIAFQLGMMACAYLGALGLAVVALCLRSSFFEHHAREKRPPLSESLRAAAQDLAAGKEAPAGIRLDTPEVEALYGAWIDDADLDPNDRLARHLLSRDGPLILPLLRRTLVAGDLPQRSRAVGLLALISAEEYQPEAIELCKYTRERARRRGEHELVRQADTALDRLRPSGPITPVPWLQEDHDDGR